MARYAAFLTLLVCLPAIKATATTYQVSGADAKPWAAILGAVGMVERQNDADIFVTAGSGAADAVTRARTHLVILEGNGAAAEQFGIKDGTEKVRVRQIVDTHAPGMQIVWEQPIEIARTELPADFTIFAKEKWKDAPLLAGKRTEHGGVLWLAAGPGASSIGRFPYLLQALRDLGWKPAAESANLWAFFDSSYRIRADSEYLARRWRQAGISAIHAAAWHNMEPDPARDEYLRKLIEACHRNAISVYAWLELPHVSETFWANHPEWREKTAVGQDAQLDWRKLMNLQNDECRREAARLIGGLLNRFDWDGVNLAELYFESLEGATNPARFTPMNADVRKDFERVGGFDPKLLFTAGSAYAAAQHPEALRRFLDYRAQLASEMQRQWLETLEVSRKEKPYLDFVVTHIDDRFEPGIRDELGADVARSLPLIRAGKGTLLVEDPATLWALGPERYAKLAEKYKEIVQERERLAIDINVVERYQDVYPTKKQTGVELLEQVHHAAVSFGQVALYFENSLEKQDMPLLPAAATSASVVHHGPDELDVQAAAPTRIAWRGPVAIDGKTWPIQNSAFVLAPEGKHRISTAFDQPAIRIRDFNGNVRSALSAKERVDVSYESRTRAIVLLDSPAAAVELDGSIYGKNKQGALMLPSGQHVVSFVR